MKKSFRYSDVRPDAARDVDDEVAFHLEMRTREFMEQGFPPEEARRRAAESFGDVQAIRGDLRAGREEIVHERARRDWWTDLRHDVRFAFRSLTRNRGFAFAAIATLALGIGANSAIFSIVNSVLLRPLPFPAADQLVVLWGRYPEYGRITTSLPDFIDWRSGTRSFSNVAARHSTAFNYMAGDEPIQLRADRVTANFFGALGVSPILGRGFQEGEDVGGDDFVVVLSHGFWQRQFGGDPAIVGKTLSLSGVPHTVIGVAPPTFRFWRDVDLWATTRTDQPNANRRSEYLTVFGRLTPGVTVDQAQVDLVTVIKRLATEYPNTNGGLTTGEVVTLHNQTVEGARPALIVFAAAVGLVLLIACANVANLLLARAAAREREMAVRSALGASRQRLMRQLLTESVLVAVLGGIAGTLLALWGIGALRSSGTTLLPRLAEVRVDVVVIAFSLGLSVLTGLLFGLAPAVRLASGRLHESIKDGARGASAHATRFRKVLVLGEVALAVMLLVGAGLLIRSFEKLNRVDPGFNPKGVLTYQAIFPTSRYTSVNQLVPYFDQLVERTSQVPGVRGVAVSAHLPMQGSGYVTFAVEGRTPPPQGAGDGPEDVQPFFVTPDYARVLGLRLRDGRFIAAGDREGSLDVAVVNTEFARRFIPDGRVPIGTRVTFDNPTAPDADWWTIVGVVDVVAQEGLDAKPYPQIYLPLSQAPRRAVWVSIRTDGDPTSLTAGAREALRSVDREVPMNDVQSMEQRVAESIAAPRVSVYVLSVFAALAMTLAAIGIYGVLSYSVAQRTREIGIRMALGASARDVRGLIVRQGMMPAVAGLVVGTGGALVGTGLLEKLLFGVSATDPVTFAGVAVFLGGVAFLASYIPARRATLVAPTEALRYE